MMTVKDLRHLIEDQPPDMEVRVNVNSIVGEVVGIQFGDALPARYIGDPGTAQYVMLVVEHEWVRDPDWQG